MKISPSRRGTSRERAPLSRLARVAYTFVIMNYAAVAGLFAAVTRRRTWR